MAGTCSPTPTGRVRSTLPAALGACTSPMAVGTTAISRVTTVFVLASLSNLFASLPLHLFRTGVNEVIRAGRLSDPIYRGALV